MPEADTYAILLAGLGIVSLVARRRLPRSPQHAP
ncbi:MULTISPECIES: PEP-CTERM sorting domain-containing protein [Methyloversatilis]